MKLHRFTAAAAAIVLAGAAMPLPVTAADTALKYEFEDGTLDGCENPPITWEQIDEDGFGNVCPMTGWSGESYVYVDQKGAKATVTVDAPEDGFYALGLCYIQCFGNPEKPDKTQYLLVNGESQGEVLFPFNSGNGWEMLDAGFVKLDKGKNTITIESYWGYTFLDYLTLSPAPSYLTNFQPANAPCNPNASPEARKLYAYLTSIYGKHVLSGQQEYCGSHCYNKNAYESQGQPINYFENNEAEFEFLQEKTGKQPAVRGIDFLFYNTTAGFEDDAPERAVSWYKDKGGIPTVTYHWNVPLEKGSDKVAFYVEGTGNTPFTTFSITNAVKEGTWEHEQIDRDIELLAAQLGKARDAGVPIIFRPLHEAEGGWFWWGAEGPEACVTLYRYLWDQLTNKYQLNNLLWEWTGYTSANSLKWYPGDKYVDIIGYDKYNAINNSEPNPSATAATFYSLVGQTEGRKMVAMSENDTIPAVDKLISEKAAWLYFCPWYQRYLTELNSLSELKNIYTSDYCITLDELPDWDTYDPELPAATTAAEPDTTTAPAEETGLRGDADCNGTVAVADAVLMARFCAEDNEVSVSAQGKRNADCNADGDLTADDIARLLEYLAGLLTKADFEA